jgi:hypothetical protein
MFSVADIVTLSGRSLAATQRDLSALALASGGSIEVRETDGEVFFTFPTNLQAVLRRNSWRYRMRSLWQQWLSPTLTQAYRLSFGLALFFSLGFIFIFLTSTSTSGLTSEKRDHERENQRDREKDRRKREYQGRYADRDRDWDSDWDWDDSWGSRRGKMRLRRRRGSGVHFVVDIGDVIRVIHRIATYRSSTPTPQLSANDAFNISGKYDEGEGGEGGLVKYFEGFFEFLFGLDNPNAGKSRYP